MFSALDVINRTVISISFCLIGHKTVTTISVEYIMLLDMGNKINTSSENWKVRHNSHRIGHGEMLS